MSNATFIRSNEGRSFRFYGDTITIKSSAEESVDGRCLLHWVLGVDSFAPSHTHERYEETFYILDGELEFTLGEETFTMRAGDFARIPPGMRHGLVNKSGAPVPMLVTLSPGAMAELFFTYRSNGGKPMDGYFDEARNIHGTVYERSGADNH